MSDTITIKTVTVSEQTVPKLGIKATAQKIAEAHGGFVLQDCKAETYAVLETKENGQHNWKFGPSFAMMSNKKGLTMEMWNYGVKEGAYLTAFENDWNTFIGQKVGPCEIDRGSWGNSMRLRINLGYVLGEEQIIKLALEFIALLTPMVESVRERAKPLFPVVLPKAGKKAKVKIVAPTVADNPLDPASSASDTIAAAYKAETPAETPTLEPAVTEAVTALEPAAEPTPAAEVKEPTAATTQKKTGAKRK